jgi:DNA-binding NtrC family response regulator
LQLAANVSEALTAIKTYEFDVLLANINIDREGDGFTVVQARRAANRDCVTVLLTQTRLLKTQYRESETK